MTKKSRQHKKGIIICFLSIDIKNKDTRRVKNKKKEEILFAILTKNALSSCNQNYSEG